MASVAKHQMNGLACQGSKVLHHRQGMLAETPRRLQIPGERENLGREGPAATSLMVDGPDPAGCVEGRQVPLDGRLGGVDCTRQLAHARGRGGRQLLQHPQRRLHAVHVRLDPGSCARHCATSKNNTFHITAQGLTMAGSLQGLSVLDCTHVLAGAWCSLILADLGADVVKIEPLAGEATRGRPDDLRRQAQEAPSLSSASTTIQSPEPRRVLVP